MSDRWAVALAVAVWLGALAAWPVPRAVAVALVVLAFALRRPALLVVAAAALAAALAAVSWRGLDPPPAATVHAHALLLADPADVGAGVQVELRIGHRHLDAWAYGAAASALRDRLAGDVLDVDGRVRPPGAARARLAVRHIAGRFDVTRIRGWHGGAPAWRAGNALRRTLAAGTASLPPRRRALLSGFLLGDQREIDDAVVSDFRSAGLTHLLAVSGQNLAFVLVAAGPALRRLQLRGRFLASVALIALFAVMTRAEPSVLRASAMAGIACWSAFAGRPLSRLRLLSLAVAALVVVDPMLVRSVGFQLSVGASLGLVLLAAPLASRLPGPRWLADPLAVTFAAQAGVSPVLLATFGGMPAVTPLANLLAVPVAGPLTAWGFTAGLVAGVVGGPIARLAGLPTSAMVGWIAGVARVAARVPLGDVDARVALLGVMALVAVVRWRRLAPLVLPVAAVLALVRPAPAATGATIARGARLWRGSGDTVLVLDGSADAARVLDALHRRRVRVLDVLVARSDSNGLARTVETIRSRVVTRVVTRSDGADGEDADRQHTQHDQQRPHPSEVRAVGDTSDGEATHHDG